MIYVGPILHGAFFENAISTIGNNFEKADFVTYSQEYLGHCT